MAITEAIVAITIYARYKCVDREDFILFAQAPAGRNKNGYEAPAILSTDFDATLVCKRNPTAPIFVVSCSGGAFIEEMIRGRCKVR